MGWIKRSARCRCVLMALAAGAVASLVTAGAWGQGWQLDSAEWRERCKQRIERKGFPVDCIELKTGKRQNGMAVSLKGNVKPEQVQVDAECHVTDTFGQVSRMRVPLPAVARVWLPSLPLE